MKTIVVTGASRGIGRFLANRSIAEGYRVIGLARNFLGDETFETIQCDVRNADQVDTALERLKGDKSLYGVINAAGVLNTKLAVRYRSDEILDIVSTNLTGTMLVSKNVARQLLALRRGRIISLSSIAASLALKGDSVYSATKAAIETFSRALARELAERGVTVNCIAPGPIPTDMTHTLTQAQWTTLLDRQIIPRPMEIHELWPLVKFLLSEEAGVVTGEVLHVGGV